MSVNLKEIELKDLAKRYFSKKYLYTELEDKMQGKSGQKWNFTGVIESKGRKFAVLVKDWDRPCGINQVRQIEKICKDLFYDGAVLVSNQYSPSAVNLGEKVGVQIMTRYDIERKIR
jgi:hypothetical protein